VISRRWYERQKMSLRELKEEFKQTEGDPAIKGKMKQVRQIRMRRRMIAAVPKATVVITNPTHYAIALAYERGMDAPVCVAKGVDALALKIREVADKHSVRSSRIHRLRAPCMPPWKSISRFRPSTTRPWQRSLAM
jgi:flagellar biosynthetic protein FlhB